jgi:hypothetical protein
LWLRDFIHNERAAARRNDLEAAIAALDRPPWVVEEWATEEEEIAGKGKSGS